MQQGSFLLGVMLMLLIFSAISVAQEKGEHKFIGVRQCAMCHRTEKQGQQFGIWEKSTHAQAYKTLTTKEADEIAKNAGLKTPAAKSPECLSCHASGYNVDAALLDKGFDIADGVQCETCHGAGSGYRVVHAKDRVKAVEAGMVTWKDAAAIEQFCKTCHNEKSPTYKEFDFEPMWKKIQHPVPKVK